MDFFTILKEVLGSIWATLKSIVLWLIDKVFSFYERITVFFKNLFNKNRNKLTNKNVKAFAIKMKTLLADENNYNTIDIGLHSSMSTDAILTSTFDIDTEEFDTENAQVVEFETLDRETKENFGDKPLLILK